MAPRNLQYIVLALMILASILAITLINSLVPLINLTPDLARFTLIDSYIAITGLTYHESQSRLAYVLCPSHAMYEDVTCIELNEGRIYNE